MSNNNTNFKVYAFDRLPIVEIVNDIILDSIKQGASDIHFDPTDGPTKVRISLDGDLVDYSEVPKDYTRNLITSIKIFSKMNITETRKPQDGPIKAVIKDTNVDLRVSVLPTNRGEKIVIRILDYSMSMQGLESLGFSESNYEKMVSMISNPHGIILVTGATGSGKSTTVYSVLQRLNREEVNIITVEDPVEMDIDGINQVQTNSDIGLNFGTVLRSVLRQDPNIIMIGEIRDTETAKIAVRASITGHLVLSTLHTNDALSTIERLLDMDVERYLLASSLTGVVAQNLARRLCNHCKMIKVPNEYEKELFREVMKVNVNQLYTAGAGCQYCLRGYQGRIAIHEVLVISQEIRDAISNRVKKEKFRELVYSGDTTTMLQDGLSKVLKGITSVEEVLKLIELDDDSEAGRLQSKLQKAIYESMVSNQDVNIAAPILEESIVKEVIDV